MPRTRLTIVLSQAPGKHPAKRSLEESIVAALLAEPDLEVSVVPNLYDLGPDHTGRLFLGAVKGDMVVLSCLITQGGADSRLRGHVRWAVRHGVTPEEIEELATLLAIYAGYPRAATAMELIRDELAGLGSEP